MEGLREVEENRRGRRVRSLSLACEEANFGGKVLEAERCSVRAARS
jgi:hypothetical protein